MVTVHIYSIFNTYFSPCTVAAAFVWYHVCVCAFTPLNSLFSPHSLPAFFYLPLLPWWLSFISPSSLRPPPHPPPLQYCRQTFFENDIIDQHKEDEEKECWEEEPSKELANGLVKKQVSLDERMQSSSLLKLPTSGRNPHQKKHSLTPASTGRKVYSPDIPRKLSAGSITPSTPPASFKFGSELCGGHMTVM